MTVLKETLSLESQEPLASSAVFSPCRQYRYELWRRWGRTGYCLFIGLNPSTADETQDDPTIRRCVGYAKKWGYGALCMANLFAFRATQPKDMMAQIDPVGLDNDGTLKRLSVQAGIVIAAWGQHGNYRGRSQEVIRFLSRVHCLKQNKDGSPGHPLYLKGDAVPYLFQP